MLTPTLPQEANSYIEGLKVDTFHDPYEFEWARGTPPSPVAHPPSRPTGCSRAESGRLQAKQLRAGTLGSPPARSGTCRRAA